LPALQRTGFENMDKWRFQAFRRNRLLKRVDVSPDSSSRTVHLPAREPANYNSVVHASRREEVAFRIERACREAA
jgi:hypothetical protein